MKLEDWVKKDMTRYIREREPEIDDDSPIRREDYGLLGKVDYERRINRALRQGRFNEATEQFNELKNTFVNIPVDHQQERKQYYRILQKSYKLIYDWVEDRHKTHRLLDKLDKTADVFDDSVKAKDLKQEATNPEMAPPSIEEQMFRKQNNLPDFDQAPDMPQMPTGEDNPFVKSPQQQQEAPRMPEAPEGMQQQPAQPQQQAQQQPPQQHQQGAAQQPEEPEHDTTHGPDWNPLPLAAPESKRSKKRRERPVRTHPVQPRKHAPRAQQPSEQETRPGFTPPRMPKSAESASQTPDDHTVFTTAARDLLAQARSALQEHDHDHAKTKLIEARFEAQRADDEKTLRAVQALERQLAAKQTVDYKPPRDRELFSSLYLQGVHAMKEGNYQKALELFGKRMSQAPGDHAARIRYNECQEVLNGQTA